MAHHAGFSTDELRFAKDFPFSATAQKIVRLSELTPEAAPGPALERAQVLLRDALFGHGDATDIRTDTDALRDEVLAYPLAKILLSHSKNTVHYEKFAQTIARRAFERMESETREPEKRRLLLDLAQELELAFDLEEDHAISVSIPDYLTYPKVTPALGLQNQRVEKKRVHLSTDGFARFLHGVITRRVSSNLPVPVKGLPPRFANLSRALLSAVSEEQKKMLEKTRFGKVVVAAFPPCFSELHATLSAGNKLTHMGNFTLASFLIMVNMQKEPLVELFSRASNYDARTTEYHLSRMMGGAKKYTPASCETMRSYGLCVQNGELCHPVVPNLKNPLQYYRKKLRQHAAREKREKEKAAQAGTAQQDGGKTDTESDSP